MTHENQLSYIIAIEAEYCFEEIRCVSNQMIN
jgi:hypothetical protein